MLTARKRGLFFSGGEPAPAPVTKDFSQIDVAAPPGMATGVIVGEARDVLEVPLSTGKTAVVWVAPTRSGGFCRFVSENRHTMGGGLDAVLFENVKDHG